MRQIAGMALAGALLWAPAHGADDPLLRPIEPEWAAQWLTPQPTTRIHGTSYLVGFGGLNVALIETSAGLILIDGALPQAVGPIEDKIRKLGHSLSDVKYILSTEPHYDHAGGLAALARDTGATVVASAPAAEVLKRGRSGPDDPQAGSLAAMPPVRKLRIVRDGETIRLGDTRVVARATPGHTLGSMSWTWRSCEGASCLDMVFAASLRPVAADGYRFSDRSSAPIVSAFRHSFAVMRKLPCDILLTSHPQQSKGVVRLAELQRRRTPNPFIDPASCRDLVAAQEAVLDARLAQEAAE